MIRADTKLGNTGACVFFCHLYLCNGDDYVIVLLRFTQFDYLKSVEIEEKVNKVRWCATSSGSQFMLSTNDRTIKLWKV
ncbi:serine/threonine protein phosphatase 2A 55 kDa regulatory subunit B beta [Pyrus ussuriensis x Pyrus communis]|uniref:Serine/threonine protein phosphatase 2A 55 kDa regulatory subunit B beta n=1 Tax=Pyrus ussuriensis x Pyrus communis TaxID=2448454 RepID=A0A5N5I2P6_9ROSA|nr:serine/threonine protein phosphatase 2A 55 kDa regulatory subunit B beta [Pyrus ussuriensis x Pyrus communis]